MIEAEEDALKNSNKKMEIHSCTPIKLLLNLAVIFEI